MEVSEAEVEQKGSRGASLRKRVDVQINEESIFKELADVQMNRILLLKELADQLSLSPEVEKKELSDLLCTHLGEGNTSLVARYLLGFLALQDKENTDRDYFITLLDDFFALSKWPIVDHIADLILSFEDTHRTALRSKIESVGHLKGKKETRPFLEKLAKIDRKNPGVAKQYALSILDEDKEKAMNYLKQAGETYARLKDYKGLESIWMLVVQHGHEDLAFFERIERILVGDRQRVWIASHFSYLVEPFRVAEKWDNVILILKKILHYEQHSSRSRSDLVRAYRAKYEGHSLLGEFLKISGLTNHKRTVEPCIASFERNIVFDVGNYVYHRTRGVGKIIEIDSERTVIDFSNNPGQVMSIQMAIHSLQPLQAGHIWAKHYEDKKEIEDIFKESIPLFLESLLSSFGNSMTMAEIKHELVGRLLKPDEWSKWWTKVRVYVKKEPNLGFNPHKKDELILREVSMNLTEELSLRFQGESDWNKKIEIGLTTLKDTDTEGAALIAIQFYKENEKNKDVLKCLHSYFFLELAKKSLGEEIAKRILTEDAIQKIFFNATPEDIGSWSQNTQASDLKRDIVSVVLRVRKDYAPILKGFLVEVPVRIHRFIIGKLIHLKQEDILKEYLQGVCRKYRENPEIFLWVARSILAKQWNEYEWVNISREDIILLVFRLLKPLAQVEKKGIRLKNAALDAICGTNNITVDSLKKHDVILELVQNSQPELLQRIYALFRDVPYIPTAHKENMFVFLKEFRPELSIVSGEEEEEENIQDSEDNLLPSDNIILTSAPALDKRRAYLDNLIHIEMPANSRDIGEAQERGDLRENAEYSVAMERQSQLQAEITTVSKELQKVRVIRSSDVRVDLVSVGVKVTVSVSDTKKNREYTILGPWDADAEKNIIFYGSPLAKVFLGKKVGQKAVLAENQSYVIREIKSALNVK